MLLVACWQWATVTANYRGNFTALFCTGALQRQTPLTASEHLYLFANSTGYDGQFYHYVAHDPFLRTRLKTYVDDARLRYRRILIPLLAYGLALGQSKLIDPAYGLVCLLSIGLGVYWSCRFAQNVKLAAAWGLLFLAMPAIPIAVDRLVTDGALAALTVAFLYYSRTPSWKLFLVLVCASLTRETGLLLVLAYCMHLAWRREFRMAGLFLLSVIPTVAWYGYLKAKIPGNSLGMSLMPFAGVLRAIRNPWTYPAGTLFAQAVRVADYLALAGMLLAFALVLIWFARRPDDPSAIATMLFTAMALMMNYPDPWPNVYHYGRGYTPVLVCLSGIAAQYRKPWLLAPVAMILPRIAIQLAPQALGILRWIA